MARRGQGLTWLGVGLGALVAARAIARQKRAYDFRGKVALVTGGSRGLGLLLARELAKAGASLALCARDGDELARAEAELVNLGANVLTGICDVTQRDQVTRFVGEVEAKFGRVDVLINNAGIIEVGPIEAMTLTDFDEAMKTHYYAPLYFIMAVAPGMQARRSGRIVNISSFGGKVAVPHLVPYSASKFALVGLSEGLRAEYAKDNVWVTTVCPGLLRTGSHDHAKFKGQNQAEYAWFTLGNANPLLSISGESAAKQIVNAARYGDAEVVLSLSAQAMAAIHGLFPGLTADVLAVVNRGLPKMGGIGTESREGEDSHSMIAPSILTTLSNRAEQANNEAG